MMETDARRCTLREMVERMSHVRDDEPFRWFQDSHPRSDGGINAGETLLVTMGQARRELGLVGRAR